MSKPRYLDQDGLDGVLPEDSHSSKFLIWVIIVALILIVFLYFYNNRKIKVDSSLSTPVADKIIVNTSDTDIIVPVSEESELISSNVLPEKPVALEKIASIENSDSVESQIESIDSIDVKDQIASNNTHMDQTKNSAIQEAVETVLSKTQISSEKPIDLEKEKVADLAKNSVLTNKKTYQYAFEFSSKEIKLLAVEEASRLTHFIEQCDNKVVIVGHTCNLGPEEFNYQLGLDRATAMQKFLIEQGINPDRLIIRSEGMNQPVASNSTKAGRKLNRRIELFCSQ